MRFPTFGGAIAAAVLVGALARNVVATDMPLPVPTPPILLRLDGVIYAGADVARGQGFTVVSLGFTGPAVEARRWLAAEDARTVGPDTALDGKDVLASVAPFDPDLLVTGPRSLVDSLLAAAPGTKVRTEGLVSRGSRTYYLRSLKVGPDAWDKAR
jgi:hypothetical protein